MKSTVGLILNFARPINLLLSGLSYLLGLSVARYMGLTINAIAALNGGIIIIFILATANLLNAYFAPRLDLPLPTDLQLERESLRRWMLYISVGLLTVSVILFFYLVILKELSLPAVLFLAFDLIFSLALSIPPIRLSDRGFGELVLSVLISGFPTIIAFLLQFHNLHRLVAFLTFPMVFLTLAYLLVLDFPGYASDQKFGRQSILVRLTWQRAIPLHNFLVIISYLIFASAPLFGIPYSLVWSSLLTFPLAIYQMVMLRNIAAGLKPNWTVLTITATALVGFTSYFLMLTFWLR
jgi:1,4-dihydroxy-2-naphthoate octaprenyltransferase